MQTHARDPIGVVVLGAGGNAGLNYATCLALADVPYRVVACDIDAHNLAACPGQARYLLPRLSGPEKVAVLNGIIAKEHAEFVHAQPDPEVRFLVEYGQQLRARVFPHGAETLRLCADKLRCQALWARELGLDFSCASLAELEADPVRFDRMRAASGRAWIRATSGAGSRAALPVTTLDQARAWARYWIEARGLREEDFMVAEFLSGPEYAVQTFWADGELLHSQARQRLTYFFGNVMPSGQSSTPAVAVTVAARDVYDTAYAAIRCIDARPHGIHCVDLKRRADGCLVPMEINYGRFFTTSDFFARLGVNTPHAVIQYVLGGVRERRVESVGDGWYWLRGLDRAPILTDDPTRGVTVVDP